MSFKLSTGAAIAIASTYGTGFTVTAVSNASEAVATLSASHGVVVNDIIEVTSGWGRLDKRLARAKAVATNDVTLELIDTSSTTRYPAGGGTGTGREITAWADISQIQGVSISGGDQQYADITVLSDVLQKQIPTVRSPLAVQITFFDDPTLSWLTTVRAAAEAQALTAIRFTFADGSKIYGNGYWSLQDVPNMEPNAPLTARIDMSFAAAVTRYTS